MASRKKIHTLSVDSSTKHLSEVRDFVAAHYALSGRTDTPYWRYCTQTRIYDPEMYGEFLTRCDNFANIATPLVHSREYNRDGQGGNFILAGMGISPVATSTYVDAFLILIFTILIICFTLVRSKNI